MSCPRSARVAAVVIVGALCGAAQAGADEAPEPLYGTVEAMDPLAGSDWAAPIGSAWAATAAEGGATVTETPCTLGDRPNADAPIFRRPIRTTGHLVVTPSGNVTFVCHAAADAGSFQRPLPSQAVVVDPIPCFLPQGRRTNDARLVVTPSLHVHLVCHLTPTQ